MVMLTLMQKSEYLLAKARVDELKDIDDNDPRCEEFNVLSDSVKAYEDAHWDTLNAES